VTSGSDPPVPVHGSPPDKTPEARRFGVERDSKRSDDRPADRYRAPDQVRADLVQTARTGFADGYSLAMTVGAVLLVITATVVFRWFPKD